MYKFAISLIPYLLTALVSFSGNLSAGSKDIDQAINRYHAGQSGQAITILKPLAMSGNIEAQILLGNITYAQSKLDPMNSTDNPLEWYMMAAEQGSPEASYALGAIYHNNWLLSQQQDDANKAEYFYQQALDRGYTKAEGPLMKMAARNHATRKSSSISYSNSSFDDKTEVHAKSEGNEPRKNKPPEATIGALLEEFKPTGDTLFDTGKLEALIRQLSNEPGSLNNPMNDAALTSGNWPDEAALVQLLISFGIDEDLAVELAKLPGHIDAASELGRSPGSN